MHRSLPVIGIIIVVVVVLTGMNVIQGRRGDEGCDTPPSAFPGLITFTGWGGPDPREPGLHPAHTAYKDVFLFDTDGACPIRLTVEAGNEIGGDLRADGKRIAFSHGAAIQTMDTDGSDAVILAAGESPRWSPDGEWIVYTNAGDVFVMRADGTDRRRLTANSVVDSGPDWSPDGTQIVFAQGTRIGGSPTDDMDLYLINPDGTGLTRLTDLIGLVVDPAWSPDGSRIAFASNFPYDWDIFVIDSDGTNLRQLTDDPNYDSSPIWSPDGSLIAFYSWIGDSVTGGDIGIQVINHDGSNRVRWEALAGATTLISWLSN